MRILFTSLVVFSVLLGGLQGFPQGDKPTEDKTSNNHNGTRGEENTLTGLISTGVPGGRGRLPGGSNSNAGVAKPTDEVAHKPAAAAAPTSESEREGRQLPKTSATLSKPATEAPSSSTTTKKSPTTTSDEKKPSPSPVSVVLPEAGISPEANRPIDGSAAHKKCVDSKRMNKAKAFFVVHNGKECKDALPETSKGLTVGKPSDQCKSAGEEVHICGLSIREVKRLAKIQFPDEHRNVDASKIDFAEANLEAGSFLQQCFVCEDPATASAADDSGDDDD